MNIALLFTLLLSLLLQAARCNIEKEGLFYMYELDEEFWWRWPIPGTDCSGNGYVGHEHAELSGMGIPINLDNGLFLTWHFSMFSSLYNRYKRSKRRTFNPEEASVFIIPYDLGLDGYLKNYNCQNSRRCTYGLPQKLQNQIAISPYWQRHQGADHVVLWSLGQYHPWPHNGCDIFMRDFCGKCTFTCYWMDSTKPESRFISLPFPSAYHWWDGIKNLPWDLSNIPSRNLTAVYLGSTQTLNPAHTKIRRAMTVQCNASTECHWKQIAHSSKDTHIGNFLEVYKQAVFCLCPPGDDPARKAVFDAILSGCIPVIFEKATLYNQYPWHIGEAAALDISVNIPGALVRNGKLNFVSVLLSIPPEVIRLKQEALARVAPRVQYAVPPIENLLNRSNTTVWDPPFKDGAEIALDGFIARIDRILKNETTNIPPSYMLQKSWHQQYDVVIVKVPDSPSNTSSNNIENSTDTHITDKISNEIENKISIVIVSKKVKVGSDKNDMKNSTTANTNVLVSRNITGSELDLTSIHNETSVSGAVIHTFVNSSVAAFALNGTAVHRKKPGHHRNHHNSTTHGVRKEGKRTISQN